MVSEKDLKKKYFEYIKSLKGMELMVPLSSLSEALDYFICENCPLKNLIGEDCGGLCIEKGWEKEFDEKYLVKIKIVDFVKNEGGCCCAGC